MVVQPVPLDEPLPVAGRSLWQDAWIRLRRNRAAVASMVVLVAAGARRHLRPGALAAPLRPRLSAVRARAGEPRGLPARRHHPAGLRARADAHPPRRTTRRCSTAARSPSRCARTRRSTRACCATSSGRTSSPTRGSTSPRTRLSGTIAVNVAAAALLLRHRRHRPRPRGADHDRGPDLARHRHPRLGDGAAARRQLRRRLGLSRRAGRQRDDAHRRHPLLAALHLLRHPDGGLLRAEPRHHLHRHRLHRVARHGAHRARPDPEPEAAGVRAGRRGARARPRPASSPATSSRTRSGRSSSS